MNDGRLVGLRATPRSVPIVALGERSLAETREENGTLSVVIGQLGPDERLSTGAAGGCGSDVPLADI